MYFTIVDLAYTISSDTIASFQLIDRDTLIETLFHPTHEKIDADTTHTLFRLSAQLFHYLFFQRLRGHDEFCSHALAFASESPKDKFHQGGGGGGVLTSTPSYDTAETAEQSIDIEWTECPICMEEFKQGEIVSWSPDDETRCQHFFHHECIKGECMFLKKKSASAIRCLRSISRYSPLSEWLLRSPHCPYCRGTIIPVDETPAGSRVDKMALHEMSRRRTTKANTTYCCAEHGLVSLQRKAMGKLSKRDKQVLDAVLAPHVDPVELKTKRGGRQEEQQHTVTGNNGAGMSSNGSDSEFSSGPLQNGNTTILDAVHVVPVDALIADMEAGQTHEAFEVAPSPSAESKEESSGEGISTSVPDIESPPASGGK